MINLFYINHITQKELMPRIPKACELCKKKYACRQDKINTSRFCSRVCVTKAAGQKYASNLKNKWEKESRDETIAIMRNSFEKFFKKTDGCWEWNGCKKQKLAYGCFTFRGKSIMASRASYEIYKGPILEKFIVLHSCDNPPCVNPNHLRVGTYLDNHKDKLARGRGKAEKLNVEQVKEIKKMLATKKPDRQIAPKFGVTPSTIGRIKMGKLWSWVTVA